MDFKTNQGKLLMDQGKLLTNNKSRYFIVTGPR